MNWRCGALLVNLHLVKSLIAGLCRPLLDCCRISRIHEEPWHDQESSSNPQRHVASNLLVTIGLGSRLDVNHLLHFIGNTIAGPGLVPGCASSTGFAVVCAQPAEITETISSIATVFFIFCSPFLGRIEDAYQRTLAKPRPPTTGISAGVRVPQRTLGNFRAHNFRSWSRGANWRYDLRKHNSLAACAMGSALTDTRTAPVTN